MDRVLYVQRFANECAPIEAGAFIPAFVRCLDPEESVELLPGVASSALAQNKPDGLRRPVGDARKWDAAHAQLHFGRAYALRGQVGSFAFTAVMSNVPRPVVKSQPGVAGYR